MCAGLWFSSKPTFWLAVRGQRPVQRDSAEEVVAGFQVGVLVYTLYHSATKIQRELVLDLSLKAVSVHRVKSGPNHSYIITIWVQNHYPPLVKSDKNLCVFPQKSQLTIKLDWIGTLAISWFIHEHGQDSLCLKLQWCSHHQILFWEFCS